MNKPAAKWKAGHLLFALCLSFVLVPSADAVASQFYDDVVVSVESSPTNVSFHGYAEYQISLTNNSPDQSHRVTLIAPSESFGIGDYLQRITRSIVLSPSSTATVSILQPPLRVGGVNVGVIIDGRAQQEPVPLDMSWHCRYNFARARGPLNATPLCVLLSRNASFDDFQNGVDAAFPETPGASSYIPPGFGRGICQFTKSESPVAAWSNNWLAYSRYDGIVLTADDMRSLPGPVNSALLRYVQCGGSLLVLGKWAKPAEWKTKEGAFGPFRSNYLHFGSCVVSESTNAGTWQKEAWEKLVKDTWTPTSAGSQMRVAVSKANKDFPVGPNLTMPVRGMFLLVLLFAFTIGPANLYILSRKKKRIWMLWTVPVASFVACAAVFSYAFLAEGWRGYIRTNSLTILDESSHCATTIAVDAFYCPLTPRSGLHFDYETEVTPMGIEWQRGGRSRTMDWTNDQHLDSGWVAARVPAHFLLRKSQMRRERLQIEGSRKEGFTVVNGFGADVRQLWYADQDGRIHQAQNIAAGAKIALALSTELAGSAATQDTWRKTYSSNWPGITDRIMRDPAKYLWPNSYVAVLDESVFLEQALQSVKSKDIQAVVFGIMEGPANAG